MALIWLSVSSGIAVLGYVLAVRRLLRRKVLHLALEQLARYIEEHELKLGLAAHQPLVIINI